MSFFSHISKLIDMGLSHESSTLVGATTNVTAAKIHRSFVCQYINDRIIDFPLNLLQSVSLGDIVKKSSDLYINIIKEGRHGP